MVRLVLAVKLALSPRRVIVIVPIPVSPLEQRPRRTVTTPRLRRWVRGALVALAVGLACLFVTAGRLSPYGPDGRPLQLGAHRQLGLPPCSFYRWTGVPCPSCGMTTSFALLLHGDVVPSLKANAVGTLLAAFLLSVIPWCLVCAVRGRLLGVRWPERALTVWVAVFVALLLARWAVVLGLAWTSAARPNGNEGSSRGGDNGSTVAALAPGRPADPRGGADDRL